MNSNLLEAIVLFNFREFFLESFHHKFIFNIYQASLLPPFYLLNKYKSL